MPEVWIQLENRPWDTMPNNIDRMTGRVASLSPAAFAIASPDEIAKTITGNHWEDVVITSPGTGVSHTRRMYAPLRDSSGNVMDALIFRRYKAPVLPDKSDAWTVPDDRKVNPWDINEKDPTDNGTMGTIPGPVIECNVGESVIVHFRNLDMRLTKDVKARTHSLHVHGFVFKQEHDGAYPLSNADITQRVDGTTPIAGQIAAPDETTFWNSIAPAGSTSFGTLKIGDRVPPGGTFQYTWNTFGWATTTGVWLYHDHSFCDDKNMGLGAIGIVVIHNPADTQNDFVVSNADFPNGSPIANPIGLVCDRIPHLAIDAGILQRVGIVDPHFLELINPGGPHEMNMLPGGKKNKKTKPVKHLAPAAIRNDIKTFAPDISRVVQEGNILLHLNENLTAFIGRCRSQYKTPPAKAIYLQLFHRLTNSPGMNINGRTFLGNTPSVVAGTATKMRFGVVGMGASGDVHTFHIHGHRWIIPGPHGTTESVIKNSVQDTPVSQFEDTRIFGPANSFGFTINGAAGSFMRAGGPSADNAKGEWHMHCHFLDHMMSGMMGSLLIVDGGQGVSLPRGEECPADDVIPGAVQHIVNINSSSPGFPDGSFGVPSLLPVKMGDTVRFNNLDDIIHGVHWLSPGSPADTPIIAPGTGSNVIMTATGTFNYECLVHGASMPGTITVTM